MFWSQMQDTLNGSLEPPKTTQTLGSLNSVLSGVFKAVVNYPILAVFGMLPRNKLLAIRNRILIPPNTLGIPTVLYMVMLYGMDADVSLSWAPSSALGLGGSSINTIGEEDRWRLGVTQGIIEVI
ncbi:hypothetical protein B0H17DRAFT_1130311 [Mycena rosella]|uniref:Uncharacterized protein n=1 Tax=Mycena rosella TaxID=1033263 RepID=A0AAD7GMD1_MYCRO|nr:hypothetical protein B0H17DRAFT_1130311 [Mycena rosella]